MEGVETVKFLYQQNLALDYLLLAGIIVSIFRPRLLVVLATSILLLRPNERMELSVPLMQVLVPVLFLVVVMNKDKIEAQTGTVNVRYLNYFIILTLVETLVLHTSDLFDIILFVVVGYLLYLAIIIFMSDDDGLKMLCRTVVLCSFLICLEPMYYHFTEASGSELWNYFHLPKSGRLQAWGMWANANETAFIACLGVANSYFLVLKYRQAHQVAAALALVPFFALVVFLTASRAGYASLLLIFLPGVLLARGKALRLVAVLAILTAAVVAHSFTPERTDAQGSADDRSELRRRGIELVRQYPLVGVGFLRARYEVGSKPLHNTYLQAFAETGVLGGMLLMSFLFGLGKHLYRVFQASREKNLQPQLISVVGLYGSSIFYFLWGNQLLSILFFLVMAQTIGAIKNSAATE